MDRTIRTGLLTLCCAGALVLALMPTRGWAQTGCRIEIAGGSAYFAAPATGEDPAAQFFTLHNDGPDSLLGSVVVDLIGVSVLPASYGVAVGDSLTFTATYTATGCGGLNVSGTIDLGLDCDPVPVLVDDDYFIGNVNPLALDFSVAEAGSSQTLSFWIADQACGDAGADIRFTEGDPFSHPEFQVSQHTFTLSAGSLTEFLVTYIPTDFGDDTVGLTVGVDTTVSGGYWNSSTVITLAATGPVAPCPLALEVTQIGSGWLNEWEAVVTNNDTLSRNVSFAIGDLVGTTPLSLFETSGLEPVVLAPSEAQVVNVKAYAVGCLGTYGQQITASCDGAGQVTAPVVLAQVDQNLIGAAEALVPIDAGAIDQPTTATFLVKNWGCEVAPFDVSLVVAAHPAFQVSPLAFALAGGAEQEITVEYTPSAVGNDTLIIDLNFTGEVAGFDRITCVGTLTNKTRYVSMLLGDDTFGDGSLAMPFQTIQEAIDRSTDGDEVHLFPETFTGPGNWNIDFFGKAIVVKSRDADPANCVVDCTGNTNVPSLGFWIHSGEAGGSKLEDVKIIGAEIGLLVESGFPYSTSPTVDNCEFAGNGTGIDVRDYTSNPALINTRLINNGYGLECQSGATANLVDCTIAGNTQHGAYLRESYHIGHGPMIFQGCFIRFNQGDGLRFETGTGRLFMNDCEINDNDGWGIDSFSYEEGIDLTDCDIFNNKLGGVIDRSSWYLAISGGQVSDNLGPGVVSQMTAYFNLIGCTIRNNTGDGLNLSGTELNKSAPDKFEFEQIVTGCTISRNAGIGVVLLVTGLPYIDFSNCLVDSNTVGGVSLTALNNSLLTDPYLAVAGCTVVNNPYGILIEADVPTTIDNSLIAFNTGPAIDCLGAEIPLLSCSDLYGNTTNWAGCIADQFAAGNNLAVDPLFCAEDNPTDRYTLSYDSPCAVGNTVSCDQIGARSVGCGDAAIIESIVDVGNDQGKQVRMTWSRSGYDLPGSLHTITGYGIYRQTGDFKQAARLTKVGEKLFGWDYLATIPARQDSLYQYVAPTLCDSTASGICFTTFMVSAMTADPGVFFDSVPDSGYSVDNLSPTPPENLIVVYTSVENLLTWNPSPDPDFASFLVYRKLATETPPTEISVPCDTVVQPNFTDPIEPGENAWAFRYWLVAVDFSGNRSVFVGQPEPPSDVPDLPSRTTLHPAVPNPFNPRTKISFELARAATVDLKVFDIAGRLIRSLITAETRPPGPHEVSWTGQDDAGRNVAAGVYFYRLQAGDSLFTRRMTLVK